MKGIFTSIVALATPLVLIGFGVRAVLLPIFPHLEYRSPGFPNDPYGFTGEERVRWASMAWAYLVNDAEISFLGNLRHDDGTTLFNERELQHMVDVKRVLSQGMKVWIGALATTGLLAAIGWKLGLLPQLARGLSLGGWIMVGAAVAVALVVVVGMSFNPDVFWSFFSAFHSLFFEGESWLFPTSDTLIRLFPIRYWQDAFLLGSVIALGGGLGLAFGLRPR